MKKKLFLIAMAMMLLGGSVLTGCAGSTKTIVVEEPQGSVASEAIEESQNVNSDFPTAEQLLLALKNKNSNLVDIDVFDESTDPNGKLGRPGYYTSKADFSDSRVEQSGEFLCGGTIEVFSNTDDCKKRTKYLEDIKEKGVGTVAINQYIYSYDKVLFRVEYDLTPSQAEEYHVQLTEILEQYQKNGVINIEKTDNENQVVDIATDAIKEFKNSMMASAKDFEVTDENSDSFFEIVIKSSAEVAKLKSSEITESQLFNVFALSAGYLCNNFNDDTDYGQAGQMAFDLIKCIVLDEEVDKENKVAEFKNLGEKYDMEIRTLPDETESTSADILSENEPLAVSEPIELGTGNYIVGEDIPAGKYDIVGIEQGHVSVKSPGVTYGDIVNEIIEPNEVTYANVRLKNGYTVEVVLGGKIKLEPK